MVRQPPLREVVGADAVAAVAAADQALAQRGLLGGALAALFLLDARLQHLQRLGLVAVLAAAVLAFGHDAGGQVHHAHGRVRLVDVLPTRAAGAEGVDAQVRRVQRDGLVLVGLGHHGHGAGAGVDAALGFGGGHALHAVAARFELERTVNVVAFDAQHDFLVAAQLAFVGAHHLHLPALGGGIAGVHAGEVACEQSRLVTARACADFNERVACVVRVLGQQQALQFIFQLYQLSLAACDFFLRHLGHVGVGQHLAGTGQVGLALLVAGVAACDLRHLGVLDGDAPVLSHVAHDVFAREQEVQLAQALCIALQLASEKGFHGGLKKEVATNLVAASAYVSSAGGRFGLKSERRVSGLAPLLAVFALRAQEQA